VYTVAKLFQRYYSQEATLHQRHEVTLHQRHEVTLHQRHVLQQVTFFFHLAFGDRYDDDDDDDDGCYSTVNTRPGL